MIISNTTLISNNEAELIYESRETPFRNNSFSKLLKRIFSSKNRKRKDKDILSMNAIRIHYVNENAVR